MTHDKAKEFFSAYHEGTLEAGIRINLEQKLAGDATLREEYTRFTKAIDQLAQVRTSPIEIPADLNDRIAARLDRHLWEQKRTAPVTWFARLRSMTFVGVAAAALVGAILTYRSHSAGSQAASLGPISSASDQLQIVVKNDGPVLQYSASTQNTVVIRTEPGDQPFDTLTVEKGGSISKSLINENPTTGLVSIEVADSPQTDHLLVAIPGTAAEKIGKGNGTLEEFAKALAAKYRVPVTLDVADPLVQVSWDMGSSDARQAADTTLKGLNLSVDQRDGNLITISRH